MTPDLLALLTRPVIVPPTAQHEIIPNIVRPCRIALVGEAPGHDEVNSGEPFTGSSGAFLFNCLARYQIARDSVSILNTTGFHPPGNAYHAFAWHGLELSPGRAHLLADLARAKPNLIVTLGNAPLHLALAGDVAPPSTNKGYTWPNSVINWRGSVFWSRYFNCKCLATLHPAYVLRDYAKAPLFFFDLGKIPRHSASAVYTPWSRDYPCCQPLDWYLTRLTAIARDRTLCAFDIEGGVNSLTCIGFATSATDAFSLPFVTAQGTRFWTPAEEAQIWAALRAVLCDPAVPKIAQNASYDCYILAYSYGLLVRGLRDDTMLKSRALFAELRTGLGTQTSIYTDHHYYKEERKGDDWSDFLRYNATDCAITYEINAVQDKLFRTPGQRAFYDFTLSLLPATQYMQLHGFRLDHTRRAAAIANAREERDRLQYCLDALRPMPVDATGYIRSVVCTKRSLNWDSPRAAYLANITTIRTLALRWLTLTPSERGLLRALSDTGLNTSSTHPLGDIACLVYDTLKLPVPIVKGRPARKTDAATLLTLMRRAHVTDDQRAILTLILRLRAVRKFLELLEAPTEPDGRWHFMINVAGTETGRPTGYKSPNDTGINPLTCPKHGRLGKLFRPIIIARPDHYFFEIDLAGADGWTVAAHCASLGDTTMIDDYRAGIKPYAVVAMMERYGREVNTWERPVLRDRIRDAHLSEMDKFINKRVQHGTSYGLGPDTGVQQILKDSWKFLGTPIYCSPTVFAQRQALFRQRYFGINSWHTVAAQQLKRTAVLTAANGSLRQFFGRRHEADTHRQWLAHEPQMNTAYATFLPLQRLWYSPANRTPADHLIIKPLLMFYDALLGEFPQDRLDWALAQLRDYFTNTITITGQPICIAYEGHYGTAWGEWVGDI